MPPEAERTDMNIQEEVYMLHEDNNNHINPPEELQDPVIEWSQAWQRWLVEENQILRNAIWNMSVAVRETTEGVCRLPPIPMSPITPFPPESPWDQTSTPTISRSSILNRTIERTYSTEDEFTWVLTPSEDVVGMMISLSSFPSILGAIQKQELHFHTITRSGMEFVMLQTGSAPASQPLCFPKMMKIVAYNCQGLKNPVSRSDLRQILLEEEPDLVLLTGTKAREPIVTKICRNLGFSDLKSEDCENGAGGICMLWNSEDMSVEVATSDAYNINATVKMKSCDQFSSNSGN